MGRQPCLCSWDGLCCNLFMQASELANRALSLLFPFVPQPATLYLPPAISSHSGLRHKPAAPLYHHPPPALESEQAPSLFVHTSFVLRFFARPRCPQLYHHPRSRPATRSGSYFLCRACIHPSPVTAQPRSPPDWNAAAARPYLKHLHATNATCVP